MWIDEAGDDGGAVEFDHRGCASAQPTRLRAAFLERSHRCKAVSEHQERFGSHRAVVNGVDLGAGEDRAGGVERRGFVRVQLAHGGPSSRWWCRSLRVERKLRPDLELCNASKFQTRRYTTFLYEFSSISALIHIIHGHMRLF